MANPEQKRTMATAEKAFKFIAAHGLTADPHTYEVAYTYVAQMLPALNDEIDAIVDSGRRLAQAEVDAIYSRSFARADNIDQAGEEVTAEIARVMTMLADAIGAVSVNADILDRTNAVIRGVGAPDDLKGAIEVIASTARKMRDDNSKLQNNLSESRREIERLQEDLQIVRENSLRDPLTKVFNRKFFDDTLVKALRDEANAGKLALLMIDIDHFKVFNDSYGHTVGDQVLRIVGGILQSSVKGKDTVARYGGEEFAVILPNTTRKGADEVANAIRCTVMGKELLKKSTRENLGRITLSIGVAVARCGDTQETLVARADRRLYAAKRSGRNRVICETEQPVLADAAA
jgi:diguanylate cyclase